jgi:hypothetical protein
MSLYLWLTFEMAPWFYAKAPLPYFRLQRYDDFVFQWLERPFVEPRNNKSHQIKQIV